MPTVNYLWDMDSPLAEADGSGTITALYTVEPVAYGRLVSSRAGGVTSYCHFDAIGSTRQLTGSSQSASDDWIYDAWGAVVRRTGTTTLNFQWAGEAGYYIDSETALFYVRARTYSPTIGRWTSFDPVWTSNLYLYSANRPAQLIDPSGLFCIPDQPVGCAEEETWTRESCQREPPCKCSETKVGGKRVTEAQLRDDILKRMGAATGLTQCDVRVVLKEACVEGDKFKGFAVTCLKFGEKNKRVITICVPSTLTYCQAVAAMRHEITHAKQYCRSGKPGNIRTRKAEEEAYREQCEEEAWQKDCDGPSEQDVKKCVLEKVGQSTDPQAVESFKKACDKINAE